MSIPKISLAALAVALSASFATSCDDSTRPDNPTPGITDLSPNTATQGDLAFTLTVRGNDFVRSSVVHWNGSARVTAFVSGGELEAQISSVDLAAAGGVPVTVFNPPPGGGESNVLFFTTLVQFAPSPTLTSISPDFVTAGGPATTLTLTGADFVEASSARLNGVDKPTTFDSPSQLRMALAATDLASSGSHIVTVLTPFPGGGLSASRTLEVRAPVPVLASLGTTQTTAGQDSLELVVNGNGFIQNSVVHFDGAPRPTQFVNGTRLSATLLAADLATAGTHAVTVVNPAPGGGTSGAATLTLVNGVPSIAFLPSSGATAGRPGFTLTIHGSGFVSTSEIRWNGVARPTTYVGNSRLTASIATADVASPGIAQITVVNPAPGGGTSNAETLTIRTFASPAITTLDTIHLAANDLVYDPVTAKIYASIPSSAGTLGNTVAAINPVTGLVTGSVFVGSEPGRMALSDDGQYLYVALEGSGSVRRVTVGSFTAGLEFSLGGGQVEEIHVMPGAPRTVAISKMNPFSSPRHLGVFVYDDGVQRTLAGPGHTGSNTIAFGETASVLYGYNNETTDFGFRTMSVTPSGVTVTNVTGGLLGGFYQRIVFAAGRVYGTSGAVVDARRRVAVGAFGGGGGSNWSVYADVPLGRAYFLAAGTLYAFDLNNYQSLGSVAISGVNEEHPAITRAKLVRWGADGLAFRDGVRIYIIRATIAAP